jgi:hypothetical protein
MCDTALIATSFYNKNLYPPSRSGTLGTTDAYTNAIMDV